MEQNTTRETESLNKRFGIIRSDQSEMNVSQMEWDLIWHKDVNCAGAKRSTGCLVCSHDVDACTVENCAACQKKQGLAFVDGIDYINPKK